MQPYFLPYVGYLQFMQKCKLFYFFDNVQFIDKGWINRNRILTQNQNKKYNFITIPLNNKKQFSKINELFIKNDLEWKKKILGQISIYRKANYYHEVKQIIEYILSINEIKLIDYLFKSYIEIYRFLNLEINFELLTKKINNLPQKMNEPDDWALYACDNLKERDYLNVISGKEIYNLDKFKKKKINLQFFKYKVLEYKQFKNPFVKNLSFIDFLAFNGKDKLKKALRDGEII